MAPTALICGITGQDGALLAAHLLDKGYAVTGTSRDPAHADLSRLAALGLESRVRLLAMDPENAASVHATLGAAQPDEIYHLAAQSSVGRSFEQPAGTVSGIVLGTLNVLEALRTDLPAARFFVAGSGECFGETGGEPASESTPFNPTSPYAVAKTAAYWLVRNYRETYGLFAATGLLFNHESLLRPTQFVTQKIIQGARRISAEGGEPLRLGRLDIWRDWGWAPDYVDAMWRMLQQPAAGDFIIASGHSHSLRDFVAEAFACVGLDWQSHVVESAELYRPSDIIRSYANPEKARRELGWSASHGMREVVRMMSAGRPSGQ